MKGVPGTVLQINVSRGGIPKKEISAALVTGRGITGDDWRNKRYHGGPRQALLLLAAEVLEQLQAAGFPVFPGALGENLTTRGLDCRAFRAGQRYRAGEVLLELTKPRTPCRTLDPYGPGIQQALYDARVKAGDPESPVWGFGGFYAAVLEPGRIVAGDRIELTGAAA